MPLVSDEDKRKLVIAKLKAGKKLTAGEFSE